MFTFKVVYQNWSGDYVEGVMQISGQPDKAAAIASCKAQLAIEGYKVVCIN